MKATKATSRRSIAVQAIALGDKVSLLQLLPPACLLLLLHPLLLTLSLRPQLPADLKFNYFDAEGNMQEVSVGSLTKGKKARQHRGEAAAYHAGSS